MAVIDRLGPERPRLVDIYRTRGADDTRANLKVFSLGESVPLSERVPLLEGLGFRVINERTYRVGSEAAGSRMVWLHDMTLERAAGGPIDIGGHRSADRGGAHGALPWAHGIRPAECADPRGRACLARGGDAAHALALRPADPRALRTGLHRRDAQEARRRGAALVGLFHARFRPDLAGDRARAEAEASEAIEAQLARSRASTRTGS